MAQIDTVACHTLERLAGQSQRLGALNNRVQSVKRYCQSYGAHRLDVGVDVQGQTGIP